MTYGSDVSSFDAYAYYDHKSTSVPKNPPDAGDAIAEAFLYKGKDMNISSSSSALLISSSSIFYSSPLDSS